MPRCCLSVSLCNDGVHIRSMRSERRSALRSANASASAFKCRAAAASASSNIAALSWACPAAALSKSVADATVYEVRDLHAMGEKFADVHIDDHQCRSFQQINAPHTLLSDSSTFPYFPVHVKCLSTITYVKPYSNLKGAGDRPPHSASPVLTGHRRNHDHGSE